MKGQSKKLGGRAYILGSSPQTAIVLKTSVNISYYICYAILLQEARIARHPNKKIQTPKDLKS